MLEVASISASSATLLGALPQVGDAIVLDPLQGDPQAVFRAFEEEWEQRWGKHRHLSDDRLVNGAFCAPKPGNVPESGLPVLQLIISVISVARMVHGPYTRRRSYTDRCS